MTTLEWDKAGERNFDAGIRKGVLYDEHGDGVVWNGLISVDENNSTNVDPIFFDGIKFNDAVEVSDFSATLKAFTYPDEFLRFEGILEDQPGFFITDQPMARFGLSYQTTCGDDVDGSESGYKLHLLYNLLAVPSQKSYQTLSDQISPVEFQWDITSIPDEIEGFRPTAHAILDSRKIDPYLLSDIENILYGESIAELDVIDHGDGSWTASSSDEGVITMFDDTTFEITSEGAEFIDADTYTLTSLVRNAHLPSLKALAAFIRSWERLVVTDNGDGTWTAHSSVPGVIEMLDSTTFSIDSDTAHYLDANTYTITSSDKNEGDIWLPR